MVDRRNLTMRDMAAAVGLLVVSLVAVLAAMGSISFGTNTDGGPDPTVDVVGGFERTGASLGVAFAVPTDLPSSWRPYSFLLDDPAVRGADGVVAARGGWLTADGRFITLIQSSAGATSLVTQEIGAGLGGVGAADAGGAKWSIYPGQRQEQVWVRTRDGVTLLITGPASRTDFETLAAAVR